VNKEELDNIQELIERKITLAEVTGGLSSSDKKFIALWNYTIELQNNWNELKEYFKNYKDELESLKENVEYLDLFEQHTLENIDEFLYKIQEIESRK